MAVRAPVARHRRGRRAGDAQGQRPGDGALQSRRAWLPSTAAQRAAAAVAGAWFRGHRVRADAGGDPAARRRPDPQFAQDRFEMTVKLPPGTPLRETDQLVRELQAEHGDDEGIRTLYGVSGSGTRLDRSEEHTTEL